MVSSRETIKLLASEKYIPTWEDCDFDLTYKRFAAAHEVLMRHSTVTPSSKISKYTMAYLWDRKSLELELMKRLGDNPYWIN